jgi:hypothetical protein
MYLEPLKSLNFVPTVPKTYNSRDAIDYNSVDPAPALRSRSGRAVDWPATVVMK